MGFERGVEYQLADIPLEQALGPRIDVRRQMRLLRHEKGPQASRSEASSSGISALTQASSIRPSAMRKMVMPL